MDITRKKKYKQTHQHISRATFCLIFASIAIFGANKLGLLFENTPKDIPSTIISANPGKTLKETATTQVNNIATKSSKPASVKSRQPSITKRTAASPNHSSIAHAPSSIATQPTASSVTPSLPSIEHDPTSSKNIIPKETSPLMDATNKVNGDINDQEARLRTKHIPPSIPITLSDGEVSGNISSNSSAINYKNSTILARANIGIGYSTYQDDNNITHQKLNGSYGMGFSLSKNAAIGTNFLVMPQMKDLALIGVYYLPDAQLRIKAAANYLWGKQEFTFPSESETIDLYQMGLFLSGEHAFSEAQYPWLHSIGVSSWTTKTHQDNTKVAVSYYTIETSTTHEIYEDNKVLSLGQLFGSAVDLQMAPQDNLVVKLSLGYEHVKFPFADGSTELNKSLYQGFKIDYEPIDHLILGSEYKKGSSETRLGIRAEMHGFAMTIYQNWGLNGIQSHKGAILSYSLTPWNNASSLSLAQRMRGNATQGGLNLLTDATTRPTQLPITFMAKVDPGSSINVANIDKAGLADANVTTKGNLVFVNFAGETINSIPSITMTGPNGTSSLTPTSDYASFTDEAVILNLAKIQEAIPSSGDYRFAITVNGTTNYIINLDTIAQANT